MPIRFEDGHGRAISPGESRKLQHQGDGGDAPVPMVALRDLLDYRGRMVFKGGEFDARNEQDAKHLERYGLAVRYVAPPASAVVEDTAADESPAAEAPRQRGRRRQRD
jgi:hypothetical protein